MKNDIPKWRIDREGFRKALMEYFNETDLKTLCFDFGRTKKALLVALRKMEIVAEKAIEVDGGEEILARADQMDIKVELKEITPCVTRVSVRAGEGFLRWDKATAQEILAQTDKIAEDLTG